MSHKPVRNSRSRVSSRGRGEIRSSRGGRGRGNSRANGAAEEVELGVRSGGRRRDNRHRGRGGWRDDYSARGGTGSWRGRQGGSSRAPRNWRVDAAPRAIVDSDTSSVDSEYARDYVHNLMNGDTKSASDSNTGINTGLPRDIRKDDDSDTGTNTKRCFAEPEVLRWAATWGTMGEFLRECQGLLRFLVANKMGPNIGNVFDFSPRHNRFRLIAHKVCEKVGATSISVGKGRDRFVCVSPAKDLVVADCFEKALVEVLDDVFPLSDRDASRRAGRAQRWRCSGPSFLDVEFLHASDSDDSSTHSELDSDVDRYADEGEDGGEMSARIAGLVAYSMTQEKIDEIWGDGDVDELDPAELFGGLDSKVKRSGRKGRRNGRTEMVQKRGNLPDGKPIDGSNKGFGLLKKMGWNEGQGLGVEGEGRTEPVSVEYRHSRRGLG